MLLSLFTVVVLQAFVSDATDIGSSSALSISPPAIQILTSSSPSSIVFSCFFENDNDNDADVYPRSAKEACCKGIVADDNDSIDSVLLQQCMLEMAQVPSSIISSTTKNIKNNHQHNNDENDDDTAKFSWVISKAFVSGVESTTSVEQYLWTTTATTGGDGGNKDRFQKDPVQTLTPYHKASRNTTSQQSTTTTTPFLIASKLDSHLGQEGGMHRLFHHSFQPTLKSSSSSSSNGGQEEEDPTYFLYLTIPKGMFIDLDDPIEATMGTVESTAPALGHTDDDGIASDTSHSFDVTTTTTKSSSVLSFRARLHAATVCDIEQPSFVSGQHLLVWEINRIVTSDTTTTTITNDMPSPKIEFATKLHLRYPHPSSTLEEWIDLPSPLLFAVLDNSEPLLLASNDDDNDWSLGVAEKVWVAAGKDEDHDWIMGMTISFCLIGVAIMLRDISRVSLWDDV